MSDHAVLFEYDEPVPPPAEPIKGAWGVGKEYRKHRRHYAKAMREYKRSNQTVHRKIFIPYASFERVGDAFKILGQAATDASEAIANSFERFYANDPVIVAKQELRNQLYAGKLYGFDPVLEGKIIDPVIPLRYWQAVEPIEGPDDYTYDVPIPTKTNFSAEFTLDTTAHESIRKLFGIL